MISIKKLEAELWDAADNLRANSQLTSVQYCQPVLALIFLRYAYSRYKMAEAEIMVGRPKRGGRVMPVTPDEFKSKSALFLPREAQFDYLLNLPDAITGIKRKDGTDINSLGEAINYAMELIEQQSEQLVGILPKTYTIFSDELLRDLLRVFNNSAIDQVGGDIVGRIYEYFLSKFAKAVASDDGVFFTPKSLVKMLVNVLEPQKGVMLDPACGSGGMFVQTGDFVGAEVNSRMTFYGQEKVDYNAQLCLMNMAVHGLNGHVLSGDDANTFYHDAHNLDGKCDYVIANPPFNVDKVNAEIATSAGRLPFGLPGVTTTKDKKTEVSNANYLWINYFYSYLNDTGRAGFVMASSATDSSNKDREIREKLVRTGHVDVMVSVGNNFFYTLSLPCSLWFFDKNKNADIRDKVLFIDARNYYTVEERTLNVWTDWQLRNLQAIVLLYRGEKEKYARLLKDYDKELMSYKDSIQAEASLFNDKLDRDTSGHFMGVLPICFEDLSDYDKTRKNVTEMIEHTKKCVNSSATLLKKNKVKAMREAGDGFIMHLQSHLTLIDEHDWLVSKFGMNGDYQDVAGLCKIATIEEIEEKNWSLTPGAYVGVAEVEDDGVDFHERMNEIHAELAKLNSEANVLMNEIQRAWENLNTK